MHNGLSTSSRINTRLWWEIHGHQELFSWCVGPCVDLTHQAVRPDEPEDINSICTYYTVDLSQVLCVKFMSKAGYTSWTPQPCNVRKKYISHSKFKKGRRAVCVCTTQKPLPLFQAVPLKHNVNSAGEGSSLFCPKFGTGHLFCLHNSFRWMLEQVGQLRTKPFCLTWSYADAGAAEGHCPSVLHYPVLIMGLPPSTPQCNLCCVSCLKVYKARFNW